MGTVDEEYVCADCGETFTKAWSDEEAFEELETIFGLDERTEGLVVLCDDCYHKLMRGLLN